MQFSPLIPMAAVALWGCSQPFECKVSYWKPGKSNWISTGYYGGYSTWTPGYWSTTASYGAFDSYEKYCNTYSWGSSCSYGGGEFFTRFWDGWYDDGTIRVRAAPLPGTLPSRATTDRTLAPGTQPRRRSL